MSTTLCDLTASARQLSLCASVSLVLAVFGPPSAHGCYHNAVHVEPGLTQRRCVGLAKTALQHVEKGLTHHLKKSKTNKNTNTQKKKSFSSQLIHLYNCFSRVVLWNVGPTANDWVLTPTAWCFLPRLSRKSSKEWRSSRWLTAASITSITWEHVHIHTGRAFKAAHTYKLYTCSGQCGEQSSPWWHVPGTLGWRGSLVWSHSLCCSGKDWGAQGPAQTVYHRQIPHCSIGVWTRHGLPNIHTDTKSICKSYIYKSLLPVSDLAAAVSK